MVNGFTIYPIPDIVERWKASALHQLCLALLPFTHARSESINADSLNSSFLQLGRRSGGRSQRTVYTRRLPISTVIHTTSAGLEPTTFLLLVRRATSSATDSPTCNSRFLLLLFIVLLLLLSLSLFALVSCYDDLKNVSCTQAGWSCNL